MGWKERRERKRQLAAQVLDQKGVECRVELAEQAQDGLSHVWDQIERSRVRDLANTAKATHDLVKTIDLLVGEAGGNQKREEYAPVTLRNIILLARGGRNALNIDAVAFHATMREQGMTVDAELEVSEEAETNTPLPNSAWWRH